METDTAREDTRKAMAYDLLQILKKEPARMYTYDELKEIIYTYIDGSEA